ncbi:MAG: hypothetical protein LBQ66_06045 [Planctomycetaceae bacterium]|nr:hypothetical protein [Planctomycetaceae bacterium]
MLSILYRRNVYYVTGRQRLVVPILLLGSCRQVGNTNYSKLNIPPKPNMFVDRIKHHLKDGTIRTQYLLCTSRREGKKVVQ